MVDIHTRPAFPCWAFSRRPAADDAPILSGPSSFQEVWYNGHHTLALRSLQVPQPPCH